MPTQVKPIPEGYHTATPYLTVRDAAKAVDFYKRAFDATELHRMDTPDGKIAHAELKIGDSIIMLSDEMPGADTRSPQSVGGTTSAVFLYVKDVDSAFHKAVAAGARATTQLADMFWGDRYGKVTDPYGHSWFLATHKEDVAPTEMKKRAEAHFSKMAESQRTRTA
jgi:PhnB protein